jgi:uncharacterized protein (DUF488 family)
VGVNVGVIGVGYEGLSIDEFCEHLLAQGVSHVADVRLNALSRKRGFSKNGLRTALAQVGIEYLHRPSLGNPRDNRDGFAYPGSRAGDAARDRFRQFLEVPAATEAISEIAALAAESRVAILCFERDQHECHRELVIESVEATSNDLFQLSRS